MPKSLLKISLTLMIVLIVIVSIFHLPFTDEKSHDLSAKETSSYPSFAVLELFTSEGCSSCPPAEELLNETAKKAKKENLPIYSLAFHVDYWNNLGWDDPYSDSAYTRRQRIYAGHFGLNSVYTPQLVVNGRYEFVGHNKSKLSRTIKKTLMKKATVKLDLKVKQRRDSKDYDLQYKVTGDYKSKVLNIALVETHLVSRVKSGENSGRTLRHDNVVRFYTSRGLKSSGSGKLIIKIDDSVDLEESSIIAYAQDPKTFVILGVGQVSLN